MIIYEDEELVIPTGLNPNYFEGSGITNNQDKTVVITNNGKTVVKHDPGFSGLGTVTIHTSVGEIPVQPFYSTTITENGDFDIFPDAGYSSIAELEITVNVQPELESKTVDSSTKKQVITTDKYGLLEVTVNPYTLDEKTVDSSTNPQEITSDVDGLSKVTVRPYVLNNIRVDSSTATQIIEGAFNKVEIYPYTLDEKTVDSSTNPQVITSDEDGLRQVTINPYVLSPLEVDSSTSMQEITGQYGTVTVNPYALDEKTVDSSTKEQTITSDADGLSKVTIKPYVLSPLEVDSSTASQEITGQYGTVKVNPYVLDSSNATITGNGDYAFESNADGLSRVDVKVDIDTQPYYDEGYSNGEIAGIAEGIAQQKAKLDKATFTENGTYTREDGWNEVTVDVPGVVNNQDKTVDSSTNTQTVTFDSGYTGLNNVIINPYVLDSKTVDPSTNDITVTSSADGLSSVTVNPVTSSIDSNIQAGNIKKDVTILGVTGTYEGGGDPVPVPVEYISNEGDLNLVFNSGYTPNDNTRIVARIAWGGEGLGSWGNYFGVQNNFALREWGGYGSATGEITWQTIGGTCAVQNVYTTPGDLSIVRNIEVGNNYVKADSSSGSSGKYSGHISDYPMFIFGASDPGNGQLTELSSREMRIYSFAIYEGITLIKNLVPYQDASLNGCFFDTVSETYIYPLQGTPTVGPVAIYQQKVVDASLNAIEVTADAGFKALSKVTVNGVNAAVDPNIIPGNIKAGVNILGVSGSFSGAIYHRIGYVANDSTDKKIFRNTGIIPTNNTRIEATVSFDDINTGQSGYGYFWGTTSGVSFLVREMGGYGSRNVSYFDGNRIGYYSSDMSSAPRTYTHGQIEGEYSFMSYGGYIDKRSAWSHTWATGDEIFIWAANKGNDTVDEYSSRVMRLYEFKIYEGDNLVFHGVPAADNEGACVLIDLVSNKMVEGEGTLTGGGVYVEPDEDNYIENGEYDGTRQDASLYMILPDADTLHNFSNYKNMMYFFEITLSTPENISGSANTVWFYGRYDGVRQAIGLYLQGKDSGYPTIAGYAGEGPSAPTDEGPGKSPIGMHKYTSIGYYNNNTTYSGAKLCIYVDGVPQLIRGISAGSSSVGGQVRLFTCNNTESSDLNQTYLMKGTRIYMIRYYNVTDNEVHVLVPAYNNNQYCLHDLTSNEYLYVNSGTLTGNVTSRFLANNGAINVYNA